MVRTESKEDGRSYITVGGAISGTLFVIKENGINPLMLGYTGPTTTAGGNELGPVWSIERPLLALPEQCPSVYCPECGERVTEADGFRKRGAQHVSGGAMHTGFTLCAGCWDVRCKRINAANFWALPEGKCPNPYTDHLRAMASKMRDEVSVLRHHAAKVERACGKLEDAIYDAVAAEQDAALAKALNTPGVAVFVGDDYEAEMPEVDYDYMHAAHDYEPSPYDGTYSEC